MVTSNTTSTQVPPVLPPVLPAPNFPVHLPPPLIASNVSKARTVGGWYRKAMPPSMVTVAFPKVATNRRCRPYPRCDNKTIRVSVCSSTTIPTIPTIPEEEDSSVTSTHVSLSPQSSWFSGHVPAVRYGRQMLV